MTFTTILKNAWKKWLTFSKAVGNFNLQVLMTFFYLIIIMPLGIYFRFFTDPLNIKIKKSGKSNFSNWSHPNENLEEARRQY